MGGNRTRDRAFAELGLTTWLPRLSRLPPPRKRKEGERFAMRDAVSSRISVNRINTGLFFDIDSSVHWFIGRNKPLNGLTLIEYLEVTFDRHFEIRQGPAGQNDDLGALNRL